MNKYRNLFFLSLGLIIILTACSKDLRNAEALQDTGLFGRHPVGNLSEESTVQGTLSGSLFRLDGSVTTSSAIIFDWSPKKDVYIHSSVDRLKFTTHIDETLDSPVFEFVFSSYFLNSLTPYASLNGMGGGGPYPQDVLNDPNYFIKEKQPGVVVYISSADLKNEPLLPHP